MANFDRPPPQAGGSIAERQQRDFRVAVNPLVRHKQALRRRHFRLRRLFDDAQRARREPAAGQQSGQGRPRQALRIGRIEESEGEGRAGGGLAEFGRIGAPDAGDAAKAELFDVCLLYTSPSPRDS